MPLGSSPAQNQGFPSGDVPNRNAGARVLRCDAVAVGTRYNELIAMETPVLTALVGAAAALGGALGSQLLAARATLRTRRLELYFQAKASGYKALLERMGEFGCCPLDQAKYLTFLAAYEVALLFASEEVAELLSGPSGISVNAQRLRSAPTEEKRSAIAFTTWYDATKAVSNAMRADLKQMPELR
jgi:hypothetical protein